MHNYHTVPIIAWTKELQIVRYSDNGDCYQDMETVAECLEN